MTSSLLPVSAAKAVDREFVHIDDLEGPDLRDSCTQGMRAAKRLQRGDFEVTNLCDSCSPGIQICAIPALNRPGPVTAPYGPAGRICVTVARQEYKRPNGRSAVTWRARICVTVARQECQRPNGRSVATSRARMCVTVARQEIERPNGRSVATSRQRICVTVDHGESRFAPSPR